MKHRSLLIFISIFNFGFLNAQYHLEQLSDSLKVYLEQGWHCWNETDETSCIPYYQKFFKAVKESGECLPCAETELARIYAWEGQYEKSIAHAQNVLKDAEKYNGRLRYELELDANNEIGGNYLELGNLEKALEYFFASLEASNEITKFAPATSKQYGAITRFNIGGVYSSMNDCKRAIKFEKEAFHELMEMGNNRTCQIADAIAGEYLSCNQSDSAKIWAFRAIQLAKSQKIGNQYEMSAYSRLAEIYKDSNPDSALYYINKALKFESAENLFMQTARIYTGKGNILSAQGKYTEARESFTKAEELLPTNAIQDLAILYHAWGKAAHKNQDHKTASEKLLQFTELNDSINSERTQKTVRELNAKYETEKKEKQIAEQELRIQTQKSNVRLAILSGILLTVILVIVLIYTKKNQKTQLEKIEKEKEQSILKSFIQGEERERNRISHELHDGVAAMIGAAKMRMEAIPFLDAEQQVQQFIKINKILENTHADVRHIAHNLLPTVLENEGIIKATQHFVSEINESKLINVSVVDQNSKAQELSQQLQLMLFRIIQELVNNIIKHSQAKNAVITFERNQNGIQIEVSDDGVGFDGDMDSGNQGLYSISQRLKSIGGDFKFIRKKDKGMQAIAEVKV